MVNFAAHALIIATALSTTEILGEGIDLGGGVVTRTDVEHYAALALDVRDMQDLLKANDVNEATNVYMDGRNADPQAGGKRLSLYALSDNLAKLSFLDGGPSFLYHIYGLSDRSTDFSQLEINAHYASNAVMSYITEDPARAPAAAVVLNMWMYATYLLYQGVDRCHKRSVADNPDFILNVGGMDEFIALWIGKNQTTNSLYAVAQEMGNHFGKNDPEAQANSDLKLLYAEGSSALSLPSSCSKGNPESIQNLWRITQQMISKATIPLMQGLIFAIMNRDQELTSLYARALVPQVSQCRPSVYKRLRTELLKEGNFDFSRTDDLISDLQEVYECLGFTCEEVGTFLDATCEDKDTIAIAEYTPLSPVKDEARIDLDILQVKILTSLQSYKFAKYLYLYGRNSPFSRKSENGPYFLRSLHQMAISTEREKADPFYTQFAECHGDTNYSDDVVINTLDGKGKYGDKPVGFRYEVIAKTIQYQIPHMYALAAMKTVADYCQGTDIKNITTAASYYWDQVAAFLIGSLEGPTRGGSPDPEDGQLLWNLASKRAFQFQTLNRDEYADVNMELEDMLFAGLGELEASNCLWFQNTYERIQDLMLVPLVQSTLRYAIMNEGLPPTDESKGIAEGEIFALSVIPTVASHDKEDADVIRQNMVQPFVTESFVASGPQQVANAFFSTLQHSRYKCQYVGATPELDTCINANKSDLELQTSDNTAFWFIGVVAIILFLTCSIVYSAKGYSEDSSEDTEHETFEDEALVVSDERQVQSK